MMESPLHERFMRRAIGLAAANPSAPFAAVLVDMGTNEIRGRGNQPASGESHVAWGNRRHQPLRGAGAGRELGGIAAVHDSRALLHVPGGHPLGGDSGGRLRHLDPYPQAVGLEADRHPGRRGHAANAVCPVPVDRRRPGSRVRSAFSTGHGHRRENVLHE